MKKIIIKDIVNECATKESGEKLFKELEESIDIQDSVIVLDCINLDFTGIDKFAGPFFNNSIGKLIIKFETDHILSNMTVTNISDVGKLIWVRTIKMHYGNLTICEHKRRVELNLLSFFLSACINKDTCDVAI